MVFNKLCQANSRTENGAARWTRSPSRQTDRYSSLARCFAPARVSVCWRAECILERVGRVRDAQRRRLSARLQRDTAGPPSKVCSQVFMRRCKLDTRITFRQRAAVLVEPSLPHGVPAASRGVA